MKIIQVQREITNPLPVLSFEPYLSSKSSSYELFLFEKFIMPFFIDICINRHMIYFQGKSVG
jgi:hypothetical protein